jgi:hypothetical protein
VHQRAERDIADGQGIARQDVRLGPGHDHVPRFEAERRDDVPLLTVSVEQQRDAGRPVRIILDGLHRGGDTELLAAEVDVPEHALVPAAPMSDL